MSKPPKGFISYSWTSDEYKATVLKIAEALVDKSVDVIMDDFMFMEKKQIVVCYISVCGGGRS